MLQSSAAGSQLCASLPLLQGKPRRELRGWGAPGPTQDRAETYIFVMRRFPFLGSSCCVDRKCVRGSGVQASCSGRGSLTCLGRPGGGGRPGEYGVHTDPARAPGRTQVPGSGRALSPQHEALSEYRPICEARQPQPCTSTAVADRKLVLIPLIFICLRVWSTVRFVLTLCGSPLVRAPALVVLHVGPRGSPERVARAAPLRPRTVEHQCGWASGNLESPPACLILDPSRCRRPGTDPCQTAGPSWQAQGRLWGP